MRACDYSGNKEVGAFLKGILSLGATRDWRQVIKDATGESISPRAMMAFYAPLVAGPGQAQRGRTAGADAATRKSKPADSPLVASAEAFDATLKRFAALSDGLRKGALDSQRNLERAAEALKEVAGCEEELQAHAQALMAALGSARDAQQTQAELVRVRALEIQARSEELARLMRGFEAIGKDAAALNASAQQLAARKRTPTRWSRTASCWPGLDELQERMTAC